MESAENSSECVPNDSKKDKNPPPSLLVIAGSSEVLKKIMEWICLICNVSSSSEIDLQKHLEGRIQGQSSNHKKRK